MRVSKDEFRALESSGWTTYSYGNTGGAAAELSAELTRRGVEFRHCPDVCGIAVPTDQHWLFDFGMAHNIHLAEPCEFTD